MMPFMKNSRKFQGLHIVTESTSVVAGGWERQGGIIKGHKETFWGVGGFITLVAVMVSRVHTYIKADPVVFSSLFAVY